MNIAPGQEQTNPWGQNFDVNRKALSFWPFIASLKKITLKSDFIHIFNVFRHVYSPRPEADNPLVTQFWRQQKAQITLTICCKFQNDLFEIWFYTHFLIILYMYTAPGQGQTNPWGQNVDVNRKLLPLPPFAASLKNFFEFWFYSHFLLFFHMYIALGQGQTTLCGQYSVVNRKALSLCPFVASFEKISLKPDFIHIFAGFYTCI